jgi:molybdopterin molybdotransferase
MLLVLPGAPVPPGADAVVKVEDTQPAAAAGDGTAAGSQQRRVVICKGVPAGKDIRQVGSDIQ